MSQKLQQKTSVQIRMNIYFGVFHCIFFDKHVYNIVSAEDVIQLGVF